MEILPLLQSYDTALEIILCSIVQILASKVQSGTRDLTFGVMFSSECGHTGRMCVVVFTGVLHLRS